MLCILVGPFFFCWVVGGGVCCMFVWFLVACIESVFSLTFIVLLLPLVRFHPFHGLYNFICSDYFAKG